MRPAHPDDADVLTAVAHAAKRYWGYPDAWIEAWREALTVTRDDVTRWTVLVAEGGDGVAGFAAVDLRTSPTVLEHLWVEPGYIGQGIGRVLFDRCAGAAVAAGHGALETDADPHALGFYVKLGGRHVGDVPADVLGVKRALPRVRFALTGRSMPNVDSKGGT